MFVSRRDFFSQALSRAINHIPKIIPKGISNMLGMEKQKAMSPDEAAFMLANRRRNKSPVVQTIQSVLSENTSQSLNNKPDNA
jgi:hypothetical protein